MSSEPREFMIPAIGIPTLNFSAIAGIDPAKGVESVECDVTLDPGWTFTGKVLGPDGNPLAGSRGLGLFPLPSTGSAGLEVLKTAEFTVSEFNPRQPRSLWFQHSGEGAGRNGSASEEQRRVDHRATTTRGHGHGPFGRRGRSSRRAGVELSVGAIHDGARHPSEYNYFPPGCDKTDQQGQFRIEGLLPGQEFALVGRKETVALVPLGAGLRRDRRRTSGT